MPARTMPKHDPWEAHSDLPGGGILMALELWWERIPIPDDLIIKKEIGAAHNLAAPLIAPSVKIGRTRLFAAAVAHIRRGSVASG